MSDMSRIDFAALAFDYWKWFLIGFQYVCTLLDKDIEGLRDAFAVACFLQVEWEFSQYKVDFVDVREALL